MREIKFRGWNEDLKLMLCWEGLVVTADLSDIQKYNEKTGLDIMQFIGVLDKNGDEIYEGDIGRFDNGDTFIVKREKWVEFYVDWIGEPECEDQARDIYRIGSAEIIGNIYEDPELLGDCNV